MDISGTPPTHMTECDTRFTLHVPTKCEEAQHPHLGGVDRGLEDVAYAGSAPAGLFLPHATIQGPRRALVLSAIRVFHPNVSPTSLPPRAASFLPDRNGIF